MAEMSPVNSVITVLLNIGHKANHMPVKAYPFTHDWSAYVQGADGIDIKHFVEKVIFRLHETFEHPVQTKTEPPYMISERGYASFGLKLELVFQNSVKPNHIQYEYDLVLPGEGQPPVKYFRQEKLIFRNPPEDFRQKLLLGGAHEKTEPLSKEEQQKEKEKKAASTPKSGSSEHKISDDEKSKKKDKKSRSSKHKKSDKDKEKSSKETKSSGTFGLARSQDGKKPGQGTPKARNISQSDSSSSSSSSDSPSASPTNTSKAKGTTASSSDSSSSSDEEGLRRSKANSNNNSSGVQKRPASTPSHNGGTMAKRSKGDKDIRGPIKKSERSGGGVKKAPNGVALETLLDLHEKMKHCTENHDILQKFVNVVENGGQYNVTATAFEFDLCVLEPSIIRKLEEILK